MEEPTVRLKVFKDRGRTVAFRERTIEEMARQIEHLAVPAEKETPEQAKARTDDHSVLSRQYDIMTQKGEWREIWLKEPFAYHEEEINVLCQVKDDFAGTRFDASKERAARGQVLIEKWNGFPEKPSMEAFRHLPLSLARALNAEIEEWMYPSGLSADFFQDLSDS